ncbi:hypothetical protein EW146_g10438 [Bondarzewia mesenterica]|uniref:Uncharacterized protein n=1 Tax=Bondarzewia mesenterica TaxID=1095465 RepID=A0A4S4KXF7_9AGAM|nr:hypothetical protein EW146_g10438 [Bondarzewia mesenterica]
MDSSSTRRDKGDGSARPPKPLRSQSTSSKTSVPKKVTIAPIPRPAPPKTSAAATPSLSKPSSNPGNETKADEEEVMQAILEAPEPESVEGTTKDKNTRHRPERVIDSMNAKDYIVRAKLIANGEPLTVDTVATSLLLFAEMIYKQLPDKYVRSVRDCLRAYALVLRDLDDDLRTEKLSGTLAKAITDRTVTTDPSELQEYITTAFSEQEARLEKKVH